MVLFNTIVSFPQSMNFNITGHNGLESLACLYSVQRVQSNQYLQRETHQFFRTTNTSFKIVLKNLTALTTQLAKSPRCMVHSVNPDRGTLKWLATLQRHLVVVEGVDCGDLIPSQYSVHLYCLQGGIIHEKYQIRSQILHRKLGSISSIENLLQIYSDKLMRRANLKGAMLKITTLNDATAIMDSVYGPPEQSKVSGMYGDLFMVLKNSLNFTFTLRKPIDDKYGGRDSSRKFGWNGMIGDIAEGHADFGIGPFSSTLERNAIVNFSVGNFDNEFTLFIKRTPERSISFLTFLGPFSRRTWMAVFCLIFIVALLLFITVHIGRDKKAEYFSCIESLTYSFSGITFVRRWSVTPLTLSARIVFISVLYTGIIVQGMWRASLTSALAIDKEVVLYKTLEDLLDAEFVISVQRSSAEEGYFR